MKLNLEASQSCTWYFQINKKKSCLIKLNEKAIVSFVANIMYHCVLGAVVFMLANFTGLLIIKMISVFHYSSKWIKINHIISWLLEIFRYTQWTSNYHDIINVILGFFIVSQK